MKKLELKHLAPYLPYGLKSLNQHLPNKEIVEEELVGISNHIGWCGIFNAKHGSNHKPICSIKPILRPLSDLAKEVSIHKTFLHEIAIELGMLKDDNFIFQYDFSDYGSYGDKFDYSILTPSNNKLISVPQKIKDVKNVPYVFMEKLLQYHFDIFGLIENGLAIDINTLNK